MLATRVPLWTKHKTRLPSLTIESLDAIDEARGRMARNSPPLLVLEALLIILSGRVPPVTP